MSKWYDKFSVIELNVGLTTIHEGLSCSESEFSDYPNEAAHFLADVVIPSYIKQVERYHASKGKQSSRFAASMHGRSYKRK